jgi:hypothetical protein
MQSALRFLVLTLLDTDEPMLIQFMPYGVNILIDRLERVTARAHPFCQ